MKGFAALVTLALFGVLYASQYGYKQYLDHFSTTTYNAGQILSTVLKKGDSLKSNVPHAEGKTNKTNTTSQTTAEASPAPLVVTHLQTPLVVKAVYMSSWVAGSPSIRKKMVSIIERTEINAIIIDVKDNTGVVTWNGRAKDIVEFVDELHAKNIYVIARISAFQDPLYVKAHPEEAVQNKQTGSVWKDHKGVPWVDAGSKKMWEYINTISREAYAKGFDEINLDYIRFPTDGVLADMSFPISGERAKTDKRGIIHDFFKYITTELHKEGIPVSADLFGIIMVAKVDIPVLGQDLHDALTTFDYVAPMVYPSHFYKNTAGYANPAAHPGEIITFAMTAALKIADEVASSTGAATSTMRGKLRPWYQDFNLGAVYTKELVRAQIDAGEKLGIMSWMLWDPGNTYTEGALKTTDDRPLRSQTTE